MIWFQIGMWFVVSVAPGPTPGKAVDIKPATAHVHKVAALPAPSAGGARGVPLFTGDHDALWLCIHGYEGSWTDPNPPYFGGLQMGYGFMQAYGGSLYEDKGTADNWTPEEQIAVAEGAFAKNGFNLNWLYSQWPISGPACS